MLESDEPPGTRTPVPAKPALDRLGIAELREYIASLRAEIERAEAAIEAKHGHRAAAEAVFRTP